MSVVFIISILSVYFAIPTFLSEKSHLLIYFPISKRINLGLDLKGGVSLTLEVDCSVYNKETMQNIIYKLNSKLKQTYKSVVISTPSRSMINVELLDISNKKQAISQVRDILRENTGAIKYKIKEHVDSGRLIVSIVLSAQSAMEVQDYIVMRSMDIIRKRIDEDGTKEIDLQRQGDNKILLQVPGAYNTEEVKSLLGKTAKLSFNFVDERISKESIDSGMMPFGVKLLPFNEPLDSHVEETESYKRQTKRAMIPVQIRPVLLGDMLVDAQATTNGSTGEYVVQIRLTNAGAKAFAEATASHIGRRLAIVLDNIAISAPAIREPILNGTGIISGNFDAKGANELAILLRSGALPAPLKVIEERTIGPSLGKASIDAGMKAVVIAFISILIFMLLFYGFWGIFADIALFINLALIFSLLALFDATLTLPGIAGIALTLGMAVDANVLIFERMREDYKTGKSVISSIDSGYKLALTTILDSNLTTVVAAIILYFFGTGAVRGFAVTLIVGLVSSIFTAVTLTKLLISIWCAAFKPKSLGL